MCGTDAVWRYESALVRVDALEKQLGDENNGHAHGRHYLDRKDRHDRVHWSVAIQLRLIWFLHRLIPDHRQPSGSPALRGGPV